MVILLEKNSEVHWWCFWCRLSCLSYIWFIGSTCIQLTNFKTFVFNKVYKPCNVEIWDTLKKTYKCKPIWLCFLLILLHAPMIPTRNFFITLIIIKDFILPFNNCLTFCYSAPRFFNDLPIDHNFAFVQFSLLDPTWKRGHVCVWLTCNWLKSPNPLGLPRESLNLVGNFTFFFTFLPLTLFWGSEPKQAGTSVTTVKTHLIHEVVKLALISQKWQMPGNLNAKFHSFPCP